MAGEIPESFPESCFANIMPVFRSKIGQNELMNEWQCVYFDNIDAPENLYVHACVTDAWHLPVDGCAASTAQYMSLLPLHFHEPDLTRRHANSINKRRKSGPARIIRIRFIYLRSTWHSSRIYQAARSAHAHAHTLHYIYAPSSIVTRSNNGSCCWLIKFTCIDIYVMNFFLVQGSLKLWRVTPHRIAPALLILSQSFVHHSARATITSSAVRGNNVLHPLRPVRARHCDRIIIGKVARLQAS